MPSCSSISTCRRPSTSPGSRPEVARRHARQLFSGLDGIKDHVRERLADRLLEPSRRTSATASVACAHARLCPRRRRHHDARHRRQHRHLQRRRRRRAGAAAVCRGQDLLLLRQRRTDVDNAGFSILDLDDIRRPRPRSTPWSSPRRVLHPPRGVDPSAWPPVSCRGFLQDTRRRAPARAYGRAERRPRRRSDARPEPRSWHARSADVRM